MIKLFGVVTMAAPIFCTFLFKIIDLWYDLLYNQIKKMGVMK